MQLKVLVGIVAFLLVFSLVGCNGNGDDLFTEVSQETRKELLGFLETSQKGSFPNQLTVDGNIGYSYVGGVSGELSGAGSGAIVISYSFMDDQLIEVDRTDVDGGTWGPITALYGPKAFIALEGNEVTGFYLAPQVLPMLPITGEPRFSDFQVDVKDTSLMALALLYSGKHQAAADLLASLQPIHTENQGLPKHADVFGNALEVAIDIPATGWAGYTAAVLASITGSDPLWEEALSYGSYVKGLEVPSDPEARLAGWLLFNELKSRDSAFSRVADHWLPEAGDEYNPYLGLGLLMAGENIGEYIDFDYQPVSSSKK